MANPHSPPLPCLCTLPDKVLAEVAAALAEGGPHLVLERLPKGAGATRCRDDGGSSHPLTNLRGYTGHFRPGGGVHLVVLDNDVRLGTVASLADGVDALAANASNVVLGTSRLGSSEYEVEVLNGDEVVEAVTRLTGSSTVLYGVWPRSQSPRFTPPDEDGEARPQPVCDAGRCRYLLGSPWWTRRTSGPRCSPSGWGSAGCPTACCSCRRSLTCRLPTTPDSFGGVSTRRSR